MTKLHKTTLCFYLTEIISFYQGHWVAWFVDLLFFHF